MKCNTDEDFFKEAKTHIELPNPVTLKTSEENVDCLLSFQNHQTLNT